MITETLIGHKDRVNSVKWIAKEDSHEETEIISCANDGDVILWHLGASNTSNILKGHTGSVTSVDGTYVDDVLTLVSSSADSTIKIWERKTFSGDIELIQTIDLSYRIALALRIVRIPGTTNLMLLYATDDDKVILMADKIENDGSRKFHSVCQLRGHEDWIRGIDVIADKEDLLVATSSQDHFIRLWRICPRDEMEQTFKKFSELEIGESIQIEETRFGITTSNQKEKVFAVALESVLQGHEGWVYSVHWNRFDGQLRLLSASIDKTIILWSLDTEVGVWMENARLGEVGGNSLGFFGAKFNKSGDLIMGHGFQGSFHIWSKEAEGSWSPCVIVGGHFNSVKDICWEPQGKFLYSVSTDQTTRLHAPWLLDDTETTWHEMARPQVHGYDMQCITHLSRFQFASAAEEKIVRTFQAPANFIENIRALSDALDDPEAELIMSCRCL